MNMTPTQTATFTKAVIEESGGDMSKVSCSYASADRSRRSVGSHIAKKVKQLWIPPKIGSLHWDSKMMKSLTNQYKLEERLVISVGDSKDIKLLGAPQGSDRRAGNIISHHTMDLLLSWQCSEVIVNMVFDTTSANTGHLTAACIAIQQALNRPLLWSGCRHHVGELIIGHVFTDLNIEASKSPEVSVFQRFRTKFDSIEHSGDGLFSLNSFNIDVFADDQQDLIRYWIAESLAKVASALKYQREDYHEFAQLVKMYLGQHHGEVWFRRPGAIHKARWMAKVLYCIKMVLLETQIAALPAGEITSRQQVPKLRKFVQFATLVYFKWWATCPQVVDAPINDLDLYKAIILKYANIDELVATSAENALKRHLWYLSSEMIPLALFSDKVPALDHQRLANELIKVKPSVETVLPTNRYGAGFGKPPFPDNVNLTTELSDLVTENSWFLFKVLDTESDFLYQNVWEWNNSPSYVSGAFNVRKLNITNDAAERAVKLTSDFINSARSEDHLQNVLQVVENDRKLVPNLRK